MDGDQWIRYWRHSQKYEVKYVEMMNAEEGIDMVQLDDEVDDLDDFQDDEIDDVGIFF